MADEENGKISLAVISLQISTLTNEIAGLRAEMREHNNILTESRVVQSRHNTEIENLDHNYDALSARVNGWSSLNSLGVVAAAVIGAIFGYQKP